MQIKEIVERNTQFILDLPVSRPNKVRLLQILYRSLSFDSQIYVLLHGSTAIAPGGQAIIFGDGVDCLGKTSCALALALASKRFVVDEFSLYNCLTGTVYGNRSLPILLREAALSFFREIQEEAQDGEVFLAPEKLGLEVADAKIAAVVSPHPAEHTAMVEEKDPLRKLRKLAILVNAHRLKFAEEGLDRNDGFADRVRKIEMVDYTVGYVVPEELTKLPYYDAYLRHPKDVVDLLKEVIKDG